MPPKLRCPQCCSYILVALYNYDTLALTGEYKCVICAANGMPKFTFTTEEVEGTDEMKKVEFCWTHANTIVDIKFIILPRRGWFDANIKPMVEMLKSEIPINSREYNSFTHIWSIGSEYWPATKALLEIAGFKLSETKWEDPNKIPGVEVPEDYAKNFHYESEVITTKESAASIAEQLSKFLGVEITTQDIKDLKKLYRNKAMELHPDRGGDAAKMSELNRLWTLFTATDKVQ